jgi:hypothetical protein
VLALAVALLGWLWLSAGHLHLDGEAGHTTSHAACVLCSGLDRAAPPPANSLPAFTVAATTALPPQPERAPHPATPAHRYASRAPPTA